MSSERLVAFSGQVSRDPNNPNVNSERVPQSGSADLQAERGRASFDIGKMIDFVTGGPEETAYRKKVLLQFERDPTFRIDDYYDLTKDEQRERVMTRIRSIAHYIATESVEQFSKRLSILTLVDPGFLTRISVHYGLFANTILNQGTPEQAQHWISHGLLNFRGLIGCYAMTELGHGSNVAGLETTATFDEETDEFIIHTPSLTATKWWIGGAAESATHSSVFANLIVKGKGYGVKPFVVPLREPETFTLLPGVTIGDIGMKMGRNAIDNGWIQFTYVRIPRTNMLMRYTKVSRNGEVVEPPIAQLAYGSLIFGRRAIVGESVECAKKAITIAIRYACVRRQFGGEKGMESKIIDYQTHQIRLVPLLAMAYAINSSSEVLGHRYAALMKNLDGLQSGGSKEKVGEVIGNLKGLHSMAAGLKAFCTWRTLYMIEECRQSLGGLGYSSYAGLATLFQDFAVHCTWEGDNTVLTLQTGRYLIGSVEKVRNGKRASQDVAFLNSLPEILKKTFNGTDISDLKVIKEAFEVATAHLAAEAAKAYKNLLQKGLTPDQAQLQCSSEKFTAAKVYCMNIVYSLFLESISNADATLVPILTKLAQIFGLTMIKEEAAVFLLYGYFKPAHVSLIQQELSKTLISLRPDLVALTDSFLLTDFSINSPLGCYDGDVYRRLFEKVKLSSPFGPHRYFESTIKPTIFRVPDRMDIIEMAD